MMVMSKFEKKFGKYAIKNLSLILIMCYACGYLMKWINPGFFNYLYLNPYEIIHHFQIWRLVTWLIVPPDSFDFWTLLMLYFYYSIGTSLERTWGTYRYNVYIFSGILFTAVGAFILYGISSLLGAQILGLWNTVEGYVTYPVMFSTYYVNMSIFLAYAATFPDYQVLLFFFLPIRVKVLGIIYGALLVYQFIVGYGTGSVYFYYNLGNRFVIAASLLNFIVFFFTGRRKVRRSPVKIVKQQVYRHEVKKAAANKRHQCAVCGRTDETNPELEFRFCSKCEGNYEYCQEHLFTHEHVKRKGES